MVLYGSFNFLGRSQNDALIQRLDQMGRTEIPELGIHKVALIALIERISREGFENRESVYEVRMSSKNYADLVKNVDRAFSSNLSVMLPPFGNLNYLTSFGNISIMADATIPKDEILFFSKSTDGFYRNKILIRNVNLVSNEVEIKKKSGRRIEIGEW